MPDRRECDGGVAAQSHEPDALQIADGARLASIIGKLTLRTASASVLALRHSLHRVRMPLGLRVVVSAAIALGPWAMTAQRPASAGQPASAPLPQAAARVSRPNVILLVADDMGYADVGVHGATDIPTPNIDRIAREGARFTNAYMVSALCSPSRAGLLTGRYPARWGHEFNPSPTRADSAFGIPSSELTIAERLKLVGYTTGMVGKWHLGYQPGRIPTSRGFDEFYGFLGATHRYRSNGQQAMGPMVRGTSMVAESLSISDAFAREAVAFVKANAAKPFFLYVAFNAVHVPLMPDAVHMRRVAAIRDPERRRHAATLVGMDDAIGAVLAVLDARGLRDRTVVMFASDNGGATLSTKSSNGALSGLKGQVLEGGVRVPFFIRWPGAVKPGTVVDSPISALDIAPTVAALAGASTKGAVFDGVDLAGYVRSPASPQGTRALFWRIGSNWAVRRGKWKLTRIGDGPPSLFDLSRDIAERRNLASANSDVVVALQAEYDAWVARMQPPKWGKEGFIGSLAPDH